METSIKVQFSKISFWGKPSELPGIIALLQREATLLVVRPNYDEEAMFALLMDLQTARVAYLMSLEPDLRPALGMASIMAPAISPSFPRHDN